MGMNGPAPGHWAPGLQQTAFRAARPEVTGIPGA